MTRKSVSERRLDGANKQITELTIALGASRKHVDSLLAVSRKQVRDSEGLVKHLKATNNALRTQLAEVESERDAAQASVDSGAYWCEKLSARLDRAKRQVSELSAANYATQQNLERARTDAKQWRVAFFVVVVFTVIAQVVAYAG